MITRHTLLPELRWATHAMANTTLGKNGGVLTGIHVFAMPQAIFKPMLLC
jgi:hypothetical protein